MYRILVILLCVSIMSCTEDERSNLTVEERKEVNQLYKAQLDSINKMLIQECEDLRNDRFDKLVDSLSKTRMEEINLIMNKKDEDA